MKTKQHMTQSERQQDKSKTKNHKHNDHYYSVSFLSLSGLLTVCKLNLLTETYYLDTMQDFNQEKKGLTTKQTDVGA